MNYREMKAELMMGFDSGDRWGSSMGMFFDAADELCRRGDDIPHEWGYRPSPFGPSDPETFEAEILVDADSDDILRLGRVLHRYTTRLDKAGHSY